MLPPNYNSLSPFEKETVLRGYFISIAISKGYLPASPEYDDGIDIILVDRKPKPFKVYLIQLKSRFSLDHNRYFGKGYWIGFINNATNTWYFLKYDTLEAIMLKGTTIKRTESWKRTKRYSQLKMSREKCKLLKKFEFHHVK